MIKYNLKCNNNHEFESWFSDSNEFNKLNKKKLVDIKFSTNDIKGLEFNPIFNKWKRSENLSVNYIICSLKN